MKPTWQSFGEYLDVIDGKLAINAAFMVGHSALRRYLCDSSYFLYIAHAPLILALQLPLRDLDVPPVAKSFLVLAGSIALLLPLYHYAVRPTVIGAVLNGRRYPLRPALAAAA